MERAFVQTDIEFTDSVILTTVAGDYSMPYVAGLLQWLEDNGASINDEGWKTKGYGNLIENGVEVSFETVSFLFTCSHEHFIIKRVSGNRTKFWGLCELFKETEY